MNIIPYNSTPIYDGWGWDSHWDLATWVAWHRGLVKKYGRTLDKDGYPIADRTWLDAWAKQSYLSEPVLSIAQPSRFKAETDYLKQFPLLYQYSNLQRTSEQLNPLDLSYKNIELAKKVVDNAAKAVSSTGKILKYGIPTVLVIGLGLLVWYGVKKVQTA
mgnify:CR=1 FL=1